jgi:hypothetical protein
MAKLRVVENWQEFLHSVTGVTQTGHARYTFHLVDGRSERDAPVCVTVDPKKHVIRWKSVHGPTFAGCFGLTEVDPMHTRVRLELIQHPASVSAALGELLMPGSSRVLVDLDQLDRHLAVKPAADPA